MRKKFQDLKDYIALLVLYFLVFLFTRKISLGMRRLILDLVYEFKTTLERSINRDEVIERKEKIEEAKKRYYEYIQNSRRN